MVNKSILTVLMTGLIISSVPAQAGWFDWNKKDLVERYSPVVNTLMYRLASCNSLQDFSRRRRVKSPQCEDNKYTSLFQDAQRKIGIQEEDILPIKAISRDDLDEKKAYAATGSSEIEVITENFDPSPYGVKRITALHESFHHKYHVSQF